MASDLTIAGLAHDLSNVFETIADCSDMLSDDPKQAKLAATIRRSAERGSRILSSFLEQTHAELELDSILDHAIDFATDFLGAVKGARIEFERNVAPGLRLLGGAAAWERVFVNLFLNAAQAIGEDGVVEIAASRGPAGVEIVVTDNGPGISAQNLERIFQPGFSTRAKRSGLGLHIVRSVVEKSGGTVVAANRAGSKGAQFRISAPGWAGG